MKGGGSLLENHPLDTGGADEPLVEVNEEALEPDGPDVSSPPPPPLPPGSPELPPGGDEELTPPADEEPVTPDEEETGEPELGGSWLLVDVPELEFGGPLDPLGGASLELWQQSQQQQPALPLVCHSPVVEVPVARLIVTARR